MVGFPLFTTIVVYIMMIMMYSEWLFPILPALLSIPVFIFTNNYREIRYYGQWKIGFVSLIAIFIFFLFPVAYNVDATQFYFRDLSSKRHKIDYFQYLRIEEDIEKYGHADAFFDGKEIKVYKGDIYEGQKNIFEKILRVDEEIFLIGFIVIILYLLIPLLPFKIFNIPTDE